jgi:glyoxylate reductase
MDYKPKVYLTSNVFIEISSNEKLSKRIRDKIRNLLEKLQSISTLKTFNGRFPSEQEIEQEIIPFNPEILGCHLSHPINLETLSKTLIFAVSTSTAGYNHIQRTEKDEVIIAHTPGVLHNTVADYTVSLILGSLRNLIDLHNYVWEGKWSPNDKWDLDQSLSSVIDNKIVGIVGLGEIGTEVLRRLYPWGVKIIYYDKNRCQHAEEEFPNLECKQKIEDLFKEADIVSLHIPLNKATERIINRDLLKLMKKDALLVNTARGGVLDLEGLLELLENGEIKINLAFDVYPEEPIDPHVLKRLKNLKEQQSDIRMLFLPHNASADSDTRGNMDIIFLENIIKLIESSGIQDLEKIKIIPEHKRQLYDKKWKIQNYWNQKKVR